MNNLSNMTQFDIDCYKQSRITTINLMLNAIGQNDLYTFDYMFSLSYDDLTRLQETVIIMYNSYLKESK